MPVNRLQWRTQNGNQREEEERDDLKKDGRSNEYWASMVWQKKWYYRQGQVEKLSFGWRKTTVHWEILEWTNENTFKTGLSLVQSSPTDCDSSFCVWSRNLVNEEVMAPVE